MKARAVLTAVIVTLLVPATASATSLTGEQRQGGALAAQVRSGATSCTDLSTDAFDHIGEYAMARALGSTRAHQAMNDRMRLMLGERGEQRMHALMGRSFAGCLNGSTAGGGRIGPGTMMGGSFAGGTAGRMMRSGDWSWMMGGTWRSMRRQDWQRLQQRWMRTSGALASRHHGWSPAAAVAVTLGGVLLVALVAIAAPAAWRRAGRPPPAARTR